MGPQEVKDSSGSTMDVSALASWEGGTNPPLRKGEAVTPAGRLGTGGTARADRTGLAGLGALSPPSIELISDPLLSDFFPVEAPRPPLSMILPIW